jgi:hypothetical protein
MSKKTPGTCPKPPCPKNSPATKPASQVSGTTTALSWCKLRGMQRKAAGKE